LNQEKLCIGLDAKRAFCNYRGLGSYSRLLIESLNYWHQDDLSLILFTPKITLKGLEKWPSIQSKEDSITRKLPQGIYKLFPEVWRGYGQVDEWTSLGLNIYHGLSNEIPFTTNKNKLKNENRVKTIVTIHDLIFIRKPELYPWWDRWNYIRKVKYSCDKADSIIALSEQTKEDLIEFLNVSESKIKTIYQAVHPRFYKNELQRTALRDISNIQRPYLLFVGAFEERKNILRLIKSYYSIKEKLHDHELVLIGRGGLLSEIEKLVKDLSLTIDVKILTNVSSEELPRYYQQATALLYPSLFEGFGLPIVEALMSETIVMTSLGSCFPESAGKGAYFIDPYSEEQISQTMIEIVELNPQERLKRISKGLEHCKKFHWKQTSEELVSHYKTL